MTGYLTGAVRARSRGSRSARESTSTLLVRPMFIRRNVVGTNVFGTNLTETNLAGVNLARTNLARENPGGRNLAGTNIVGTDLARTHLVGTNLAGSVKVCCRDGGGLFCLVCGSCYFLGLAGWFWVVALAGPRLVVQVQSLESVLVVVMSVLWTNCCCWRWWGWRWRCSWCCLCCCHCCST